MLVSVFKEPNSLEVRDTHVYPISGSGTRYKRGEQAGKSQKKKPSKRNV